MLKTKIFLRTAVLLLALIGSIAAVLMLFAIHTQRIETKRTYQTIAGVLAQGIERLMLWDDRIAIMQSLDREMMAHHLMEYTFIVKDKQVYVTTFKGRTPPGLMHRPGNNGKPSTVWEFKDTDGAVFYDIAVPVGETGAVLRVGMKRHNIDKFIYPVLRIMALVSFIVLLVGIFFSYLMAFRATREITTLSEAMRSYFDKGDETRFKAVGNAADVSDLAHAFVALVSERKQAEEDLRALQERFVKVLDNIDATLYVADMKTYEILFMNRSMKELFGRDMTGETCWGALRKEIGPCHACTNEQLVGSDGKPTGGCVWKEKHFITGKYYVHHDRAIEWTDGRLARMQISTDITELTRMEEQLQQARKMESVGRLAGGIAHDSNNMLSIIIGNAEIIFEEVGTQDPIIDNLNEIQKAAHRSADLIRQLLAFARKQTIDPRILDLNKTIAGMLKMLQRLIGENIDLAWLPKTELWAVRMDPSQVDQVLANLCINARDSIVDVGKLTIETDNVTFDDDYCRTHTGYRPGEYAMIGVSDNGAGMNKETLDKIFEPFFTTKDIGIGTGLGLATVYGIVKQNGGFINVYSEVGKGTVFRIYLPKYIAKDAQPKRRTLLPKEVGGDETILLVEDEKGILKLTTMMLERLGYKVIHASSPVEAIRMGESYPDEIQVLMTDVVMPEMSGRDVAARLLQTYPALKCLFMSGYTGNVIAHHGVLDKGIYFIGKPFSNRILLQKYAKSLMEPKMKFKDNNPRDVAPGEKRGRRNPAWKLTSRFFATTVSADQDW